MPSVGSPMSLQQKGLQLICSMEAAPSYILWFMWWKWSELGCRLRCANFSHFFNYSDSSQSLKFVCEHTYTLEGTSCKAAWMDIHTKITYMHIHTIYRFNCFNSYALSQWTLWTIVLWSHSPPILRNFTSLSFQDSLVETIRVKLVVKSL